jgi:hypothetical protein
MESSYLNDVEAVIGQGRAVVAADDGTIVASVKEAIVSGKSASFYLTREQANAVKAWYWTPERVRRSGIRPIADEERKKIENELGVRNISSFRCSRARCGECDHAYGAFEFLQQGVREHGLDMVNAIFALEGASFLRVNPVFFPVCPNCNQMLRDGGIEYDCDGYGGCCYQETEVIQ